MRELVRSLYKDEKGEPMILTDGQCLIFYTIFTRKSPRVHLQTYTQYGKSHTVALAVLTRVATFPDKFMIVAGREKQANIVMGYIIQHAFDNIYTSSKLESEGESLERLQRERSKKRLTFKHTDGTMGEVMVLSADSRNQQTAGDSVMGFGAPNVILDEAALIDDEIEAKIFRMLGAQMDNFYLKIGNPFRRNHFFKDSVDPNFLKLNLDWKVGLSEGRLTQDFINEAMKKPLFDILYENKFPPAEMIDDKGFIPLLEEKDVRQVESIVFFGDKRMGVDPSGEGCFDDKTEILTKDGFKYFRDLSGDELVFSVDPQTEIAEWQPIQQIHKYKFDGELNLYAGRRGVNFAITDNHNLLVQTLKNKNKWSELKLERFDKLPNHFLIKRTNSWVGLNPDSIEFSCRNPQPNGGFREKRWRFSFDDWAKFLGWFVSEGSVTPDRNDNLSISIAQNRGRKRNILIDLLVKMGIKFQEKNNDIKFSNNAIGQHLLEHCRKYASNKRVPLYIKEATQGIIRSFLDAFILGDGYRRKSGGAGYYSTSKLLMDDLQECLVKLGVAGQITLTKKAGSKFMIGDREVVRKYDTYALWENKTSAEAWIVKDKIQRVPYNGYVYCVTSEKHKTILVRREGVTMWSGNSDETKWVVRDKFGAKCVATEKKSTPMSIALKTLMLMQSFGIKENDVFVDNFGVGANVAQELARMHVFIRPVNVGDKLTKTDLNVDIGTMEDREELSKKFYNLRSYAHWLMREWLIRGGMVENDPNWAELLKLKYKANLARQIQIMSKDEMRRQGIASPNQSDALMLTFCEPDKPEVVVRSESIGSADFDPRSVF